MDTVLWKCIHIGCTVIQCSLIYQLFFLGPLKLFLQFSFAPLAYTILFGAIHQTEKGKVEPLRTVTNQISVLIL